MSKMNWLPKDPDGLVGVPGKGYINASDFSQEDLDNLIKRAKNRKIEVHQFLLGVGLVPAKPQFELELPEEDPREFEKAVVPMELNSQEEPKKRTRRTKAEMADK